MPVEAFGKSHPGCVRQDNEDRILIEPALGLFVVCDGMGGHQHGEIAADLATAAIRFYTDASSDRFDVSWPFGYNFDLSIDANRMVTAIRLANRQVWRRAEQQLDYSGMGTTVGAALIADGRVVAGNVGDSRIYLLRHDSELSQISVDDTIIAGMLQKGMLSHADAANHPMRNVLTQAAGPQETVEAHIAEQALEPGDMLLLCSDGLYNSVDESAMRSMLAAGDTLERTVDRLVQAALAAGAPDNVSVVVLRYG